MIIFYVLIPIIGIYFVYKWIKKRFKQIDVEQRIKDIEINEETYDKIKYVDKDDARRKKKALDDFMEETQDQ